MRAVSRRAAPRPDARTGRVRIRDKDPRDYRFNLRKPLKEGGHNNVYLATHKPTGTRVIYRENFEPYDEQLEREMAGEVSYNALFSSVGVAPKLFDYGYFAPDGVGRQEDAEGRAHGFFWQVLEKFDEDLKAFTQDLEENGGCDKVVDEVERQLVGLFTTLCRQQVFCYDIHPRNVVVQHSKAAFRLALIDFDDTYCISDARIRLAGGADRAKLDKYTMTLTDLLTATLLVFSNNSSPVCGEGRPYFRRILRAMVAGRSEFLPERGRVPDLNKVVRFLGTSVAQGRDTTLDIMQHWAAAEGEVTTASAHELVENVLDWDLPPVGRIPARFHRR
jgi:hypothetical protein